MDKDRQYSLLIRHAFLSTFVENIQISAEEKLARAKKLSLHLASPYYCCAVISAETNDTAEIDMLLVRLLRVCEDFFYRGNSERGFPYISNDGRIVVLLLGDTADFLTEELVHRLIGQLKKHCKEVSRFCIGIGSPFDNLSCLAMSKEEAEEALSYQGEFGDVFINSRDIYRIFNHSTIHTSAQMKKVIQCFHENDLTALQKCTHDLTELVRRMSRVEQNQPYPSSIRHVFLELTSYVFHIAADANVNVERSLGQVNPYSFIFSGKHTEELTDWFVEICRRLLEVIHSKKNEEEQGVVVHACRFISENLSNADLGLSMVSAEENLSASYFSRLFSASVGMGINEYIRNRRLHEARLLLCGSRLDIAKIAENVGFHSAAYFTSVFKRSEGCTPSEYRRNCGQHKKL